MCIPSPTTEKEAANFVRGALQQDEEWAQYALKAFQRKGWLMNYDPRTCEPKLVVNTHTGVDAIKAALSREKVAA